MNHTVVNVSHFFCRNCCDKYFDKFNLRVFSSHTNARLSGKKTSPIHNNPSSSAFISICLSSAVIPICLSRLLIPIYVQYVFKIEKKNLV